MKQRVPHCANCEFCKEIKHMYSDFYCYHEVFGDEHRTICVDRPPKTSPQWCPKREQKNT
jgi:hypothetical protein